MIRFANNDESNNNSKKSNKHSFNIEKVKDLLKAIFEDSGYSTGSFYQDSTLVDLVDLTEKILFKENKTSLHLIIDRNPNNSLDITIDKIE
jgi:hypothetical protein